MDMTNEPEYSDAESLDDLENILGMTSYEYFDADDEEPDELNFGD